MTSTSSVAGISISMHGRGARLFRPAFMTLFATVAILCWGGVGGHPLPQAREGAGDAEGLCENWG